MFYRKDCTLLFYFGFAIKEFGVLCDHNRALTLCKEMYMSKLIIQYMHAQF